MPARVNHSPLRLLRILQQVFAAQARDAAAHLSLDDLQPPDLSYWVAAVANAVKPVLLQMFQEGMVESARRISRKRQERGRAADSGLRSYSPGNVAIFGTKTGSRQRFTRSFERRKDLGLSFALFNPRVLDAVDAAAFRFCRATLDTATIDLRTALRDLRKLLKEGLERGAAVQLLAREVRRIFADPARAFRIAVSEGSRAVHGGQLMAARESGVVRGLQWEASSDACPRCLALDLKEVPLGEPFYVDPKGGAYAVCKFPPLHPH